MDNKAIYNKNIDAFMHVSNDRDEIIEKLNNIEIKDVDMENEIPCVIRNGRKWALNSRYDSVACANTYAEDFSDANENAIFLIFGFGNGDYIRAVLEQCPNNIIIIYEPDVSVFKTVMLSVDVSDILENANVFIAVKEICEQYYLEYMYMLVGYGGIRNNKVRSLPNYERLYIEEYKKFISLYLNVVNNEVFTRNTMLMYGKEFVNNSFYTLPDAIKQFSIAQVREAFEKVDTSDIPAILVSAGPSLDKNVELLKTVGNRAFIMVVDTALKSVLRRGIQPDMTITIDGHKPLVLFEHEGFSEIPMVCNLNTNPKIYDIHSGGRFYYLTGEDTLSYFYDKYNRKISHLESGGSVANDAFSFLKYLGFKDIILIGQDLAYPNNEGHAKDAYDGSEKKVDGTGKLYLYVEDIHGEQVLTESNMDMYRKWFENQIYRYKELNVIDATEGGALIHGSTVMTLKEAIDRYCTREVDFKSVIRDIKPAFSEEEVKEIVEELRDIPEKLSECEKKIKECNKDYDKLHDLARKQKFSSGEYKRVVERIGEFNSWASEDYVMEIVNRYAQWTQYEVLDDIYDYDEKSSEYTKAKQIIENGIKMNENLLKGIESLREDYKVLYDNL